VIFNEQQWWNIILHCRKRDLLIGSYVDYYTEETIPLYGLYDFLICNTKRHWEAFSWHPQAWYVPWGTDVRTYRPAEGPQTGGAGAGRDPETVVFFHSAGMAPQRKGTEQVLYAFERMRSPGAKLLIHTQLSPEETLPETAAVIGRLKERGSLEIVNETVPAPGLYHRGDVYVYPSHLEGIGLTMAEALACGLPLITVDYPPMNEFADPEVSTAVPVRRLYARADGYYWPKNDADLDALAAAMDSYCMRRPKLEKLKQKARAYAESRLDWRKNSAELLDRIREVRPVDDEVKERARAAYSRCREKHRMTVKELVKQFLPGPYALIRDLLKREA
jgi:glycosyltransferase involved in cell wall biosynthesis